MRPSLLIKKNEDITGDLVQWWSTCQAIAPKMFYSFDKNLKDSPPNLVLPLLLHPPLLG